MYHYITAAIMFDGFDNFPILLSEFPWVYSGGGIGMSMCRYLPPRYFVDRDLRSLPTYITGFDLGVKKTFVTLIFYCVFITSYTIQNVYLSKFLHLSLLKNFTPINLQDLVDSPNNF